MRASGATLTESFLGNYTAEGTLSLWTPRIFIFEPRATARLGQSLKISLWGYLPRTRIQAGLIEWTERCRWLMGRGVRRPLPSRSVFANRFSETRRSRVGYRRSSLINLVRVSLRFRELIGSLVSRELRGRYRGSFLGKFWLLLQPLAYLAIYMIVFGQLFRSNPIFEGAPDFLFPLAMLTGLIPWLSFSESIQGGSGCIMAGGSLLKKYAFPSEILPVTAVLVGLFTAIVGFLILSLAVLVLLGHPPRMLWLLPIALILQGVFSLGIVLILSSVTVYVRDLTQMIPMFMTFWFFMSPIFMFAKVPGSPELLRTILKYNPFTYLIAIYREIFVWTPEIMKAISSPDLESRAATIALPQTHPGDVPWYELGVFAACAFGVFFIGLRVFRRLKDGFPDEV